MFTDAAIKKLIAEPKRLQRSLQDCIRLKPKPGHNQCELDIVGVEGTHFRLIFRQGTINPLDFSVILACRIQKTNQLFRLTRYNGKSHEHTNHIERETFYGFHIHLATERYQHTSWREDGYAVITDRYSSFEDAINCLLADCGFEPSSLEGSQQGLFR